MKRSVTILGATGSVGGSTLDLIEREPERFEVVALTANCDVEKLAAAAIRTRARHAVVADESCLPALRERLAGTGVAAAGGPQAVCEAARMGADWTMAAIVGLAGLGSAMAAFTGYAERGLRIAALVDVSPGLVGRRMRVATAVGPTTMEVRSLEEIDRVVAETGATIALLCVPIRVAQETVSPRTPSWSRCTRTTCAPTARCSRS